MKIEVGSDVYKDMEEYLVYEKNSYWKMKNNLRETKRLLLLHIGC